jgi:hypothetical protein
LPNAWKPQPHHELALVQRDQDVGGLDVAVDDPLLVRVLDGLADLDEEIQSFPGRELSSKSRILRTKSH